jgi:hypothetical protein
MDLYQRGTVESFTASTLTDTEGLNRFASQNQLVGGSVWVAILSGGSYVSHQWRNIIGYNGAGTITVEKDWTGTASPVVGQIYEIFMSLTVPQWDEAINRAIRSAWPAIFEVRTVNPTAKLGDSNEQSFTFSDDFDGISMVRVADPVNYPGYGARPIPRGSWIYSGPMSTNGKGTLVMTRPLREGISLSNIYADVHGRYPTYDTYASGTYPPMDQEYLKAQSISNVFGMLAAATHQQSHVGNYQTMQQYHQGIADRRKAEIAATLAGADFEALAPD